MGLNSKAQLHMGLNSYSLFVGLGERGMTTSPWRLGTRWGGKDNFVMGISVERKCGRSLL